MCNEQLFHRLSSFQAGAGDIPDDPIPGNSAGGNDIMGGEDDDDDESSRSSGGSEACSATLPSAGDIEGEFVGVVGEPDTSSSDSCDTSTSAESNPEEVYDTSMEEVLEQVHIQSDMLKSSNRIDEFVSIQKPYFGSIVTGSVSTTSNAAAAIVPSLQLAAATAVLADGSKGPRAIPTKVTLAPPPHPTVVRPSKPTLSVGQQRPVVATPATVEKRQMVRCDDRLTFGSRTLAGIVISSGPGGHFETYEVVEALNVNNMLAKFEAADPSCVDGPEDPRRKAEIMAAVKSHFSAPCRRMPPGKVPKIGTSAFSSGVATALLTHAVDLFR